MARGIPMGAKAPPKKMMMGGEGEMENETEYESGPEATIIMMGKEMDDAEEEAYGAAAPQGDFSAAGLNVLVDGLNAVLPLFEIPDYERFTDGATTLPPKFVKLLNMVNDAAKSAGLDDMAIDVSSITDDRSLKMAAGKLRALAGNTSFKRFLRSERPGGPAPKAEEAPAMGGAPAPMSGAGEDELMMSRLG